PAEIARTAINLAPLEVGNAFCEAKSELKYFEAASVRVPTIASPTEPFAAAITHGVNGFLANRTEEWYHCLTRLVTDGQHRVEMGNNALSHVLATYTPIQTMHAAVAAYNQIIQLLSGRTKAG